MWTSIDQKHLYIWPSWPSKTNGIKALTVPCQKLSPCIKQNKFWKKMMQVLWVVDPLRPLCTWSNWVMVSAALFTAISVAWLTRRKAWQMSVFQTRSYHFPYVQTLSLTLPTCLLTRNPWFCVCLRTLYGNCVGSQLPTNTQRKITRETFQQQISTSRSFRWRRWGRWRRGWRGIGRLQHSPLSSRFCAFATPCTGFCRKVLWPGFDPAFNMKGLRSQWTYLRTLHYDTLHYTILHCVTSHANTIPYSTIQTYLEHQSVQEKIFRQKQMNSVNSGFNNPNPTPYATISLRKTLRILTQLRVFLMPMNHEWYSDLPQARQYMRQGFWNALKCHRCKM